MLGFSMKTPLTSEKAACAFGLLAGAMGGRSHNLVPSLRSSRTTRSMSRAPSFRTDNIGSRPPKSTSPGRWWGTTSTARRRLTWPIRAESSPSSTRASISIILSSVGRRGRRGRRSMGTAAHSCKMELRVACCGCVTAIRTSSRLNRQKTPLSSRVWHPTGRSSPAWLLRTRMVMAWRGSAGIVAYLCCASCPIRRLILARMNDLANNWERPAGRRPKPCPTPSSLPRAGTRPFSSICRSPVRASFQSQQSRKAGTRVSVAPGIPSPTRSMRP